MCVCVCVCVCVCGVCVCVIHMYVRMNMCIQKCIGQVASNRKEGLITALIHQHCYYCMRFIIIIIIGGSVV